MAWMVATALSAGKAAVVELPTMREVEDLMPMLRNYGLKPFAPAPAGGWVGDVAVLNAETMPAADRYRTYLAVALGQVKVVIGTRAVMYAPVEGPALFAILEDAAYQNMDGMMPYPQARGVMRLRAKSHGGVFVAMAQCAHSAKSVGKHRSRYGGNSGERLFHRDSSARLATEGCDALGALAQSR